TGGGATVDRLFTLGTSGGTIDSSGSGALILNNSGSIAYSGTGARAFTLTGSEPDNNTLAAALADNGGATSLTKSGAGTWVLTGTNTYSGVTTISAGTLQVGTGGASGTLGTGNVVDNGRLVFNVSSSLTVGTISGTGSVTNDGTGTVILPGDNTYQGGTTINAGTLQIGNGGATGKIDANDPILNNGTLIVNSTGDLTLGGAISGTGQLIKRGSGLLKLLGNSTYSGPTTIDAGARLQLWQGNTGANATPAITNNGTLIMMRQDNNVAICAGTINGTGKLVVEVSNGNGGDSTLTGTNTYTGGTYILGGGLILGDNGITPYGGSIIGDVFLTNDYIHATFGPFVPAILTFNRAEDFTFPGNIVGDGQVTQTGVGTVTLTGNNTYTNGTTISAGTLQVGAGGTSGSIGTGNITDNSILVFNRSDSLTINSVISGGGSVVKAGAGTLTLTATNTYSGPTTVSNGTLVVTGGSLASDVYVEGGTLVPAALNAGGELNLAASLIIDSGAILVPLNRSLAVTNLVVNGAIIFSGGNLQVANAGPALVAGDKFYIFNQPVTGITVSGAGATWQNDLAVDGSITALTVPPAVNTNPPVMQVSFSANTLNLAWPTNLGWTLQTNSVALTAANQWFPYPGSAGVTNVSIPINPAKTNVFFRMVYP
ncbi:MAG TPA: autotransporter-associated beta strand repeat-containing protein, partial [Candidatus Paceibacterota bacterium]|nr:autotransporter-associated beta strand repeat-containing protein [Candidatus Paceibacterota bacterium]